MCFSTNPNFILSGKVRVTCSVSKDVIDIEGPTYFVSSPGLQKVVYALEDTRWITIHRTDNTDLEDIEEEVIAKSYEELPDHIKQEILE